MLQLEKSFFALGINIIADGRAASLDCFLQHLLHRPMEPAQLIARERSRSPARTYSGPEQRLIGVNIADPAQQFLVQQRALDRRFPPTKQLNEPLCLCLQRLIARRHETIRIAEARPNYRQPSEPAWIDEA